jgi:hypothetical protein
VIGPAPGIDLDNPTFASEKLLTAKIAKNSQRPQRKLKRAHKSQMDLLCVLCVTFSSFAVKSFSPKTKRAPKRAFVSC